VTPPLTTIRQPMQRLGTTAVDLLMSLMDGTEPDAMRVQLPTRLVRRATTGPPPTRSR
jgi:LacI family transcriptional regulator